jgi:hypothetical protein
MAAGLSALFKPENGPIGCWRGAPSPKESDKKAKKAK